MQLPIVGEEKFMANLEDLLKSGLVLLGEELVWKRRIQSVIHKALIVEGARIKTEDGKLHKTPSGAAKHLNSGKPVDGWLAWKVKRNGLSLSELRSQSKS